MQMEDVSDSVVTARVCILPVSAENGFLFKLKGKVSQKTRYQAFVHIFATY